MTHALRHLTTIASAIVLLSAAIVAGSGEAGNAKRLIAFLTSPGAAEAIKKSGMEPAASIQSSMGLYLRD